MPLDKVELVFIHVKPHDSHIVMNDKPLTRVTKQLSVELHDVTATRHMIYVSNRMLNLVQHHYDLSATSITGIPMKV